MNPNEIIALIEDARRIGIEIPSHGLIRHLCEDNLSLRERLRESEILCNKKAAAVGRLEDELFEIGDLFFPDQGDMSPGAILKGLQEFKKNLKGVGR